MRVGLLAAFAGRPCGGPDVYEREIIKQLSADPSAHEYHLYCLDRRAPQAIGIHDKRFTYHVLKPSVRVVSMMTSLPWTIAETRPEVFYSPLIPPPFSPAGSIMSMPCSSLIRHPEFYPPFIRLRLRFLLHRAVPTAAKVICPSEHVRDVVQETFAVPIDRLPVVYPGVSPMFRLIDRSETKDYVKRRYEISYPYFLFSGRWEQRKNIVRTLEAFALFKRQCPSEHRLVLTGGQSWDSAKVHQCIERLNLQKVVVNVGKTALDELPYLYGAADALVFASLWEGFGMPIVEALACGTPVITSNISAMPETSGGATLLVDPYSIEEIAAAMERVTTDVSLCQDLRTQGLKRAQEFSWSRAARSILNLLEEVKTQQDTPFAQIAM